MNIKLKLIGACALVGAFAATPASAEWAQSIGMGQKSTNMGNAGVASASDYDVWYTNPAGAANITRTTIGLGVKVLNTTNLENKEPGFNHGVDDTVTGSDNGYLPSVGAYVPGLLPNVVLGVGFGAPFALAAKWGNNPGVAGVLTPQGQNGFNPEGFQQVEVLTAEIAPTIGIKVTDKLNIGASVSFTTVKHLFVNIAVNTSPLGLLGATTSPLLAQTDDDLGLPIPPWEFATSPHEATYTIGAQYQLLPNVAVGATYREEMPVEYDLNLRVPVLDNALTGPHIESAKATTKLEIPRHLQIGVSVDVTPQLKISGDVKWTNWSNAVGVGSSLIVEIAPQAGNVLLGGAAAIPVNRLVLAHKGDDTYSFHLGAQYKVLPNLELQAGFIYDPAVFDTQNLSFLAYSSDRYVYSLGATLDLPDSALLGSNGDWEFTVGGQFIQYDDFNVAAGQSSTFGTTNSGTAALSTAPDVAFSANTSAFEGGGYIWTAGASAVYKFGVPEEVYLK